MNVVAKFLTKFWNQIDSNNILKRIKYNEQMEFVPGMQDSFNIWKSASFTMLTEYKRETIWPTQLMQKKHSTKSKMHCWLKNNNKLGIEGNFFSLTKSIFVKWISEIMSTAIPPCTYPSRLKSYLMLKNGILSL